jgi:hypothetical protein
VENLTVEFACTEDLRISKERLNRLQESEKCVNEELTKCKAENSVLRMENSNAKSEASFQRERAKNLESYLLEAQEESKRSSQRRFEVERTLVEFQRELRAKDDLKLEKDAEIKSCQVLFL